MLTEISWHSYWTFIAFTVAFYYLLLLVAFWIKGRLVLLGGGKAIWQKQEQATPSSDELPFEPIQSTDMDFLSPAPESEEYAVYACVDEVNASLQEAQKIKCEKEALIIAPKQIVAKYPSIKETQDKASLTSVIVAQCAHLCFVYLTDADIDRVWLD